MKKVSVDDFDQIFDEGVENIFDYVNWSQAYREGDPPQTLSVALPDSVVAALDEQVARLGTSRSKLLEAWVREKLSEIPGAAVPWPGVGLPAGGDRP